MKIVDFLTAEGIIPDLAGSDKRAVLNELAEKFAAADGAPAGDRVLQVLLEREKISTTAIGEGVAIPHGKLADVDRVRAVFARSTAGVKAVANLIEVGGSISPPPVGASPSPRPGEIP